MAMVEKTMSKAPMMIAPVLRLVQPKHFFRRSSGSIIGSSISKFPNFQTTGSLFHRKEKQLEGEDERDCLSSGCERVLVLVLPGKVKVRRSHPQDIFAPSLNCVYKHLLLFHFIENEISILLKGFVRLKLDNFKINILDY